MAEWSSHWTEDREVTGSNPDPGSSRPPPSGFRLLESVSSPADMMEICLLFLHNSAETSVRNF